jgi:nucleoside-diphosphate-sugar epimerase
MGKKIVVTGGSGAAGAYVVRELLAHGCEVVNADLAPPRETLCEFVECDSTDYDQVLSALGGCDGVVSFASNPEPDFDFSTGAERFENNTLCTYNVFNAACALQLERVVWASSETVMGFPFAACQPASVPVDESHTPQPQNSYAISKLLCEEASVYLNRLYGVSFVGLRLSNILYEGDQHRDVYSKIPGYWNDLSSRKFNLWSYIDARDVARCARLALESDITGVENFIVAAQDTIMKQRSLQLMGTMFPDVTVASSLGDNQALISSAKAESLLGWKAQYSWRDVIPER